MVTLETANNALKSFYLDAVTDALNKKTNPFLAKIESSANSVVGKEVKKLVRVGMNGGIGAGTETGALPTGGGNDYRQLTLPLKNLYGTIEISDKAIRASANSEGAFVNLLNDEMQSLIQSAKYNFGRMIFGDGTGKLAMVDIVNDGQFEMQSVKNLFEGMIVDVENEMGEMVDALRGCKITNVDRVNKLVTLEKAGADLSVIDSGYSFYLNGSAGQEITGLSALFGDEDLYGQSRENSFMKPVIQKAVGAINENFIQTAIDRIEENSGSRVNFILCSSGVRRALLQYYKSQNIMLPTVEIEGGFTALSFNGIPVVVDRFCPTSTMYLLNTDDFKIHQLCDWQWMEGEDGKILRQIPGKPVYTATLVKYAELLCEKPCGQGMLTGITEA